MVFKWLRLEIRLCRHCRIPHIVFGHYRWERHLLQVRRRKWAERALKEHDRK